MIGAAAVFRFTYSRDCRGAVPPSPAEIELALASAAARAFFRRRRYHIAMGFDLSAGCWLVMRIDGSVVRSFAFTEGANNCSDPNNCSLKFRAATDYCAQLNGEPGVSEGAHA